MSSRTGQTNDSEIIKENDGGVNSSIMYLTYCKNFCKCHNVPSARTTIKSRGV
jgi:hypothetical protein